MPDIKKYKGRDFDAIMDQAAKDFKTTRENLEYQIVQEKERKGLFTSPWIVKVRLHRSFDPRYKSGGFEIEEKEGDVFLSVTSPGCRGDAVKYEDIAREIQKRDYEIHNKFKIKNLIENPPHEPCNITECVERAEVDGTFDVSIDDFDMNTYLKVDLPRGKGKKLICKLLKTI